MSLIKFDYVFGCRSKDSKYARDGAIIVAKVRGSNDIIISMFKNGSDYIGHPKTYDEAVNVYNAHLAENWTPMSIDDLDNTAIDKNQIDEYTLLSPS